MNVNDSIRDHTQVVNAEWLRKPATNDAVLEAVDELRREIAVQLLRLNERMDAVEERVKGRLAISSVEVVQRPDFHIDPADYPEVAD